MTRIRVIKQLSLFVALSTTLVACSSTSALAPSEKLHGSWSVATIQNQAVLHKSTAKLEFHSDNRLSGSASCNNIMSSYQVQNNTLSIKSIATTRKMCPPILMEQESKLLGALGKVKRFQLDNDQLSMFDQQGTLQIIANRLQPSVSK